MDRNASKRQKKRSDDRKREEMILRKTRTAPPTYGRLGSFGRRAFQFATLALNLRAFDDLRERPKGDHFVPWDFLEDTIPA